MDVKIRSMLRGNKTIRLMSNPFVGPGTFDGQPWSHDGRTSSYVSYQLLPFEGAID